MTIVPFAPQYKEMVVRLLVQMAKDVPYFNNHVIDAEKIGAYYEYCSTDQRGFGRLVLSSGRVGGILAAYSVPMIFNNDIRTQDLVFFVSPECPNRTVTAKRLVLEYVQWAKSLGAVSINLGVTLGIADKAASALLRHCGFKATAHTYELGE